MATNIASKLLGLSYLSINFGQDHRHLASSYYLERIRDAFPDIMWTNYRRVQIIANPDHAMILLDNGIAFRFENDEDTNLTRERIVLDALRSSLKVIPILRYPFQANCGIL